MKKTIALLMTMLLFLAVSCAKTEQPIPEEFSLTGTWKIDSLNYKPSADALYGSLSSLLNTYFTDVREIVFSGDGTAVIGENTVEYSLEGDKLRLVWDGSKNFVLTVTQNEDGIKLNYEDMVVVFLSAK